MTYISLISIITGIKKNKYTIIFHYLLRGECNRICVFGSLYLCYVIDNQELSPSIHLNC